MGKLVHLAGALAVLALALALMMGPFAPAAAAWADDTGDSGTSQTTDGNGQQITINDSIIDTGNLLGSKLSAVMDAVDQVKQKTGVKARLMYLPHLDTQGDAEAWCRQVLDTSGAEPNTAMLAVASQDGNLVSCVSANSDAWLSNNVQEFADAALKPITDGDDPDWGGAAIAWANKIIEVKETSASHGVVMASVGAAVGVLVVLVVVGIVFHRLRRKKRRRHAGARVRGKDGADSARKGRGKRHGGKRSVDDSSEGEPEADAPRSGGDSADVESPDAPASGDASVADAPVADAPAADGAVAPDKPDAVAQDDDSLARFRRA